ncbi:MAG: serine hydrolase domain-containing protein [Candidatus Thorarchaeota archaeon]
MSTNLKKIHAKYVALICILGLLLLTTVNFASAQDDSVFVSESVENQLEQFMEDGEIPAMQEAIIENNEIKYVKGFGNQTDSNTVFVIGSIQKMFTSCCVMQLVENGVIDLDDDVDNYLPYNVTHPHYPDIPITPRMLLTHRSGLDREIYYLFCWDTEGLLYPEYKSVYNSEIVGMTLREFMENTFTPGGIGYRSDIWQFEPGTEFGYSSVGYTVLKHLIEVLSGTTYEQYMQEHILTPMGLTNTGFNVSIFENHSIPYIRYMGTNHEFVLWNGNTVLRSTATDLAKFLLMHISSGTYNGVQILESETIDQMREIASVNQYSAYGLDNLGYGYALHKYVGDIYGHSGSSVGGMGAVFYNPITQRGIVHLQNLNHVGAYNMTDVEFVNEYYGKITRYMLEIASLKPLLSSRQILVIGLGIFSGASILISIQLIKRRKTTAIKPIHQDV